MNTAQAYLPPGILRYGHVNTIGTHLFRQVRAPKYKRIRIDTPDQDFLDLDIIEKGSKTAIIALHGLEGSAESKYMKGIAAATSSLDCDLIAMNHRGCSGETNLLYSSYHSGKSDDLETVVNYALNTLKYHRIFIVGFSLGGNISLKYAGEMGGKVPPQVRGIVAISVPCDLEGCAVQLQKGSNKIYLGRFIRSLKKKALEKLKRFPDAPISKKELIKVNDFNSFDGIYTAPANGFKDEFDYWEQCSSKQFIPAIKVPTLIINAQDDPFLSYSCFPYLEARENSWVILEAPRHGGHVGFATQWNFQGMAWHEQRVVEFLKKHSVSQFTIDIDNMDFHSKYVDPYYLKLLGLNFARKELVSNPEVFLKSIKALREELSCADIRMMLNYNWRPSKVGAWIIGLCKMKELEGDLIDYLNNRPEYCEHVIINLTLFNSNQGNSAIREFVEDQQALILKMMKEGQEFRAGDLFEKNSLVYAFNAIRYLDSINLTTNYQEVITSNTWNLIIEKWLETSKTNPGGSYLSIFKEAEKEDLAFNQSMKIIAKVMS